MWKCLPPSWVTAPAPQPCSASGPGEKHFKAGLEGPDEEGQGPPPAAAWGGSLHFKPSSQSLPLGLFLRLPPSTPSICCLAVKGKGKPGCRGSPSLAHGQEAWLSHAIPVVGSYNTAVPACAVLRPAEDRRSALSRDL